MTVAREIDLRDIADEFVVHYGGRLNEVNAFTFGNSLVALARSMQAANAVINPGHEIEIAIQAMGPGSFRARLRATKKTLKNLFSTQGAGTGIIVGLLTARIWEATHPANHPNIVVNADTVVIECDNERVILPRDAYEPYKAIRETKEVIEGIRAAFEQLERDESISEFGIARRLDDEQLLLDVPREKFSVISGPQTDEPDTRYIEERATMEVIRAILEKSLRRWEFVWRGMRIAAPLNDGEFYALLADRKVSLATGDVLDVTLKIKQSRIGETSVYENVSYEVTKVHGHRPHPQQDDFRSH